MWNMRKSGEVMCALKMKAVIRGFIALPEKVCASHKIPCDNMGPEHTNACAHAHACACLFFTLPVDFLAISWLKWGNPPQPPPMYSITFWSFSVCRLYVCAYIYVFIRSKYCVSVHTLKVDACVWISLGGKDAFKWSKSPVSGCGLGWEMLTCPSIL